MTTPSLPKTPRQAGLVQVSAVGMAFLGALMLMALVFLATGRGSETEALGAFPAWVLLFVVLIWRATDWRQTTARGLTLLGAEFLALPVAWLFYQGMPSLSGNDPRLLQTLRVLGLGLMLAALASLAGSFLRKGAGRPVQVPLARAIFTLGGAVFVGEALYGVLLLVFALLS